MKTKLTLLSTIWLLLIYPDISGRISNLPVGPANKTYSSDLQTFDGWNISKVKNGIQICTRWIINSHHEKSRQVKGIVILQAAREQIAKLITDVNEARKWMIFLDELTYYNSNGNPGEWYAYGRINVLGKIAGFDVVTNNCIRTSITDDQTVITMNGMPDYLPYKSGIHRITGLYSSWCLTGVSPEKTKIEFLLQSDMKPVIPAWMTDPVIARLLISTLEELRDHAGKYNIQ